MDNYSRVYAKVDLDAVSYNLEQMKQYMEKEVQIMAVVKTDGYGHGAVMIAKHVEPLDYIGGFAVATAEEALILRRNGIRKPVLILGTVFEEQLENLILNDIRISLFQVPLAEKIQQTAKRIGKTAYVHIKLDTAMSRLGIRPEQADSVPIVKTIAKFPNIRMEGIFTHFSKADETDKSTCHHQMEKFWKFVHTLENEGLTFAVRHCANSAGIIDLKEYHCDMVRAGISLYGMYPSGEVCTKNVRLKPAMSLHSRIVYIKEVEPGVSVGYGGTYTTTQKTRIATVPVGYGDGYPRSLSNKGMVQIHRKEAPILGRICMDQFMVDVTKIADAKEGDEVLLFGESRDGTLPLERLCALSGRFNYEFVCDLGIRIPRVYEKNGEIIGTKDWFDE